MDATVEEVGPCKKKLKITVPSDQIAAEIEKSYEEVLSNVELPGFRKGRVPRRLIEKRFGSEINKDVKKSIISNSFHDAMEANQLNPLGEPEIDYDNIVIDPDTDLTYEVTIEIKPEFDLSDYKGMKVTRPAVEITDEHVTESLSQLAKSRATFTTSQAPSTADDVLVCDLVLLQGDTELERREEVNITPSHGHILGVPAPELAEKLAGLGAGDTAEIDLDLSQGGKEASEEDEEHPRSLAKVSVREVKNVIIPEVDDDWAKTLDFDNLEELKENIGKKLAHRQEREIDRAIEQQLVGELMNRSNFELPDGVVQRELERAAGRYRIRLQVDGLEDENELDSKVAEYRNKAESEVYEDFRQAFLLDKLASMEKIYVTEDEVDQQIQSIAASHGKWPNEVKEHYESRNMMPDLRAQIREAKSRAFLREHAEITNTEAHPPESD